MVHRFKKTIKYANILVAHTTLGTWIFIHNVSNIYNVNNKVIATTAAAAKATATSNDNGPLKIRPQKHGIILLHSWCTVESERRWFHFSLLVAACNMKFCDKIKGIHCDFVILFLTFFCSLSLSPIASSTFELNTIANNRLLFSYFLFSIVPNFHFDWVPRNGFYCSIETDKINRYIYYIIYYKNNV